MNFRLKCFCKLHYSIRRVVLPRQPLVSRRHIMKCEVIFKIGFVLVLTVNVKTFEVSCRNDDDCEIFLNSTAFCDDGICQVGGEIYSNKNEEKRPPRGFGDKCTNTLQCVEVLEEGGECWNGICQCRLKYHYNSTFSFICIRDRIVGEYCEPKEDQCYQWDESFDENVLYCSNNHRCECVKNWKFVDDACKYSNTSGYVDIRALSIALVIVLARIL